MQEKSPIKKRILQYIDTKGFSKYEFYKKSGITRGILDQDTGISEDNIARFLDYDAKVNTEWLLTGKGSMFKDGITRDYTHKYETSLKSKEDPKSDNAMLIEYVEENEKLWNEMTLMKQTIDAQSKTIQTQEKLIDRLEKLLDPKSSRKTATNVSGPARPAPGQLKPEEEAHTHK